MNKAAGLVDGLKRELKARGITYAELAGRIQMSEASVKRMFAQKNFTLNRLDEILQACQIEFSELAQQIQEESPQLISQLSSAQEKEIVSDQKLLIIAVSALNQIPLEHLTQAYQLNEAELVKYLLRLDKIGFLQLLPNNRIKLLVSRTFRWLPNGPIQAHFRQLAANDFLAAHFDGAGESMQLVNVMLTQASISQLQNRLKQLGKEIAQLHQQDARYNFAEKTAVSCLLAARPWLPLTFKELLRPEMQAGLSAETNTGQAGQAVDGALARFVHQHKS